DYVCVSVWMCVCVCVCLCIKAFSLNSSTANLPNIFYFFYFSEQSRIRATSGPHQGHTRATSGPHQGHICSCGVCSSRLLSVAAIAVGFPPLLLHFVSLHTHTPHQ